LPFPGTIEAGSDEDEDDEDFTVDDTMIEAAHMGDRPRLRKILNAGMSVDAATDEGGSTPLMLAAQAKHKACLTLLLQRGAKVDLVDADGWSALMFAAKADDKPLATEGAAGSRRGSAACEYRWHLVITNNELHLWYLTCKPFDIPIFLSLPYFLNQRPCSSSCP
jgi:ankyrin repeat protein